MSEQNQPIEEAFKTAKVKISHRYFMGISLCAETNMFIYGIFDVECQKVSAPVFMCQNKKTGLGRPLYQEEMDILIESGYRDLCEAEQVAVGLKDLPNVYARAVKNQHFYLHDMSSISKDTLACMIMAKDGKYHYCANLGQQGCKSFFVTTGGKPMTGEEFDSLKKMAMKNLSSEKSAGYLSMFEMEFMKENRRFIKGRDDRLPPSGSPYSRG